MKRLIPFLAAAVVLTGCGSKAQETPAADLPADEEVLLYINDREIPAWRYFCWLERACAGAEEDLTDAQCAAFKAQALADTALYAAVEDLAAQHGVTLTAEEAAALDTTPWADLSPAHQAELSAVGGLYAKLCALAAQAGSSLAPDGETLAAFAKEQNCITLDRILIPAGEDREAARQRASEIFSRLNGAEDQGAAFAALTAEGADQLGPRTLSPDSTELDGELLAAARELQEGQCSGILESQEGFSILRRLETDPEALREPYFDDCLLDLAEAAEVTTAPAYDELDPAAFDQAWEQVRTDKNAS